MTICGQSWLSVSGLQVLRWLRHIGKRMKGPGRGLSLLLICSCAILLISCGKRSSAPEHNSAPHPVVAHPAATDFVICVDNSGSISRTEQGVDPRNHDAGGRFGRHW
jgi:hypothetical protein